MPDATGLTTAIKKAAMEATESTKPTNICFGSVVSANPLAINMEQKLTLSAQQLILTRNVTDYITTATVWWATEEEESHTHEVIGTKQITVHNALEVGEQVILIRQQGGQKYIVLDRVGGG